MRLTGSTTSTGSTRIHGVEMDVHVPRSLVSARKCVIDLEERGSHPWLRQYDSTNPQDKILLSCSGGRTSSNNELRTVFDERYERVSEFSTRLPPRCAADPKPMRRGIWGAFWFDKSPLAGAFLQPVAAPRSSAVEGVA